MKSNYLIAICCVSLTILAIVSAPPSSRAKDEKLKPQELIAKHLDSIGPAEKRKAIMNRATSGTTTVAFRVGGTGTMTGKGNILSQGNLIRLGFNFPSRDYPGEQIAFDGNKVTAGQMSPGNYPPFSGFFYEHGALIKEGLLFGTLSTGWALYDVQAKQGRLDLNGLKKIDGRQLYELKYMMRGDNGNIQSFLYFDPDTFHHVRSQFKLELPTSQVSRISDTAEVVRYTILEQFDQFKEVDGLTLPHSYKLDYTVDAPRGSLLTGWTYSIESIDHNKGMEKSLFSLQ
jgi:hypothetical protein